MSFAEQHLDILVALRTISLPTYVDLIRRSHDDASYKSAIALVADRSEKLDSSGSSDSLPDLTRLLSVPDYREFLARVSEVAPDDVPVVQHLLETREYEQRLARTKAASFQDYLDELRVVSALEIASALVDGTIVNALDEHGRPLPVRSDEEDSGAFLHTPTATAYVDGEVLRTVLADFASGANDLKANPQGLRLRGVVIGGDLNLNWLRLGFPLGFEGCDFHQWVSANHLSVPWLSFDSCDFTPVGQRMYRDRGALNAASIKVESSLRFWGCRGLSQLFIPDAVIGDFSPANPDTPDEAKVTAFRTEIDGARFGKLWIPDGEGAIPFEIKRSVRIESVELAGVDETSDKESDRAAARRLHDWLTESSAQVPEDVWQELEQALRRSGRSRAATEFGVLGARARTRGKPWGWLERLLLDRTVRYFYGNLGALWWLLGLLVVTFGVAFAFAEQFVQSPLANPSSLPDGWLGSFMDRAVWSLLYAGDTVLSPISLGQAETVWPESSWLTLVLGLIKGSSLLLLGLLVVGVTGLAEKRGKTTGADS
ncbi:hypothetical protein [Nocardioides pacificus]